MSFSHRLPHALTNYLAHSLTCSLNNYLTLHLLTLTSSLIHLLTVSNIRSLSHCLTPAATSALKINSLNPVTLVPYRSSTHSLSSKKMCQLRTDLVTPVTLVLYHSRTHSLTLIMSSLLTEDSLSSQILCKSKDSSTHLCYKFYVNRGLSHSLLLQLQVLYRARSCSLLSQPKVLCWSRAQPWYSLKFCINQELAHLTPITASSSVSIKDSVHLTPITASSSVSTKD